MPRSVVTRFAPSPTGYLHIGGARTALFNWLFARANHGKLLLRIEDTDRARHSQAAVDAITEGLAWLGIEWDGDPVSQFSRMERHCQAARELLDKGLAYRCYCSRQELADMREKARKRGLPARYDGTCRERDPKLSPKDVAPVIRFKAPRQGETSFTDRVHGRIAIQNDALDDLIILRADGTPTYNLSVVVDDHDMGITHIIRGDDHLTNAARQAQIYQALGWPLPEMAHLAMIHGPDGAKLSKRHGALGVGSYRAMGYIPAAMRNYLARLGWSHGDDEIFSTRQMISWFSLDDVGRSPARFDFAKLEHLNGHYLRQGDDIWLMEQFKIGLPFFEGGSDFLSRFTEKKQRRFLTALPGLKFRAKTLVELMHGAAFLIAERPLALNGKAQKLLDGQAREHLAGVASVLAQLSCWEPQTLQETVTAHAEQIGVGLGKLAQPLRAALTGSNISPGIFDVLTALGKRESLARIEDQLN